MDEDKGKELSLLESSLLERISRVDVINQALVLIVLGLACIITPLLVPGDNFAEGLIRDVGIAILTAGVLGVGYEYKLRDDFVENTTKNLKKVLEEHDDELVKHLEKFRKSGLKDVHESLTIELLEENFKKLSPRVRVLQTWTGFRDDGFMTMLGEAAQRKGCRVEVLLLDPMSEQAKYRADAVDHMTERGVRNDIANDLKELTTVCSQLPEGCSIEVKVYKGHPGIQLYDFYHTKIMGMHWRQIRSTRGPQFEIVGPETTLSTRLDKHFESLWWDPSTRDAQVALAQYDQEFDRGGTVSAGSQSARGEPPS